MGAKITGLHKTLNVGDRVRVKANDYSYDGWLMAIFLKRSGATRLVVEDDNGRLFIHNLEQIAT